MEIWSIVLEVSWPECCFASRKVLNCNSVEMKVLDWRTWRVIRNASVAKTQYIKESTDPKSGVSNLWFSFISCYIRNRQNWTRLVVITAPCFYQWLYIIFSNLLRLYCFCYRGQEQHIRYEHIYLPEPTGQSDLEYAEIKRPRLEMGPESLMRPSSHRPQLPLGGAEDMAKVSSLHKILCMILMV